MIQPTNLPPFTKFCCTIGNLPTSYMVSLSYEEQLLWLCDYLKNTIIPAINQNSDALKELQDLYLQLKNYVDNYLDNLDLQEDINNKLDEMALDGTLETIINQEIFGEINENLETLNKKIDYSNIKPIELFYHDINESIQGGCIENNNLYIYSSINNTSGKIRKYNIPSKTLVSTYDNINFYHGNGMTFINNKIYSADFYDENNNYSKKLSILDIENSIVSHINPFENEDISRCWGVTKFDAENIIVATSIDTTRLISSCKFFKLNINDLSYTELNINLNNFTGYNYSGSLLCDIVFKNNRLYILTSYTGQIYQFNLEENTFYLNKIYNIPTYDENGIAYSEFEGIESFENNLYGENTFAFHCNVDGCLQTYLFNLESNLSSFAQPLNENMINERVNVILKKSSLSLYENGSDNFPFKTLERAISCINNNKKITGGDIIIKDNEIYSIVRNHRSQNIALRWDGFTPTLHFKTDNPFVNCNVNLRSDTDDILNITENTTSHRISFRDSKIFIDKTNINFGLDLSRNTRASFQNSTITLENELNNAIVLDNSAIANLGFTSITGFNTNALAIRGHSIAYINSYIKSLSVDVSHDCFKIEPSI